MKPYETLDSFEIRMRLNDGLWHRAGSFSSLVCEDNSIFPKRLTFYVAGGEWYAAESIEFETPKTTEFMGLIDAVLADL